MLMVIHMKAIVQLFLAAILSHVIAVQHMVYIRRLAMAAGVDAGINIYPQIYIVNLFIL